MRLIALLAAAALLGACSDPFDPSRFLVGQWGSSSAELIALRSGAELRFDCSVIVIDEPIELTPGNQFGAQGKLLTSMAAIGDPPRATISGSVSGSTIELQVATGTQSFPLTLEGGVAPEPDEVPTCPL